MISDDQQLRFEKLGVSLLSECDVKLVVLMGFSCTDVFLYLFPEFIVLLQESQGSGLEASQQDFEFFLQFRCFPGLCRHVAPVYLQGDRAERS